MTGGQGRAGAVRRTVRGMVCRIPGSSRNVAANGFSPDLVRGPLVRGNRLTGRRLAGTLVPQLWVMTESGHVRLDEVLGDSFAVPTAVPSAGHRRIDAARVRQWR
ncbi:hypothetical protein ACIBJF_32420 [Streptomyces sp. NPDC050743]|uniref:hypothetical protein n=1 Tax=Streptomyces sp. NPDC050743 TaxID=3365634 RepID=UPI003797F055